MTTFNKREESFEAKFAHDAELQFKAEARRNRLLGEWVAGLLGRTGEEVANYVKDVIKSDFEMPGDEDVFAKVKKDLNDAGVEQSDHQIRRTMDEFLAKAVEQLQSEG